MSRFSLTSLTFALTELNSKHNIDSISHDQLNEPDHYSDHGQAEFNQEFGYLGISGAVNK